MTKKTLKYNNRISNKVKINLSDSYIKLKQMFKVKAKFCLT